MALIKKKPSKKPSNLVEEREDLKKLSVFVVVVNRGLADPICKLFQHAGSNAQFIQRGNGTAIKEIRDILGIEDTSKDIIFSIIKKEAIEELKPELNAFFMASKYNKGIGFSIPMTSIIGVKLYQFFTDSL